MVKKLIPQLHIVQSIFLIPIALFTWFAWQGFSGMAEADHLSFDWYASLIGGISALIIVSASVFGLIQLFKRTFRLRSK